MSFSVAKKSHISFMWPDLGIFKVGASNSLEVRRGAFLSSCCVQQYAHEDKWSSLSSSSIHVLFWLHVAFEPVASSLRDKRGYFHKSLIFYLHHHHKVAFLYRVWQCDESSYSHLCWLTAASQPPLPSAAWEIKDGWNAGWVIKCSHPLGQRPWHNASRFCRAADQHVAGSLDLLNSRAEEKNTADRMLCENI